MQNRRKKWNFPLNFRTMRKLSHLYSGIFQTQSSGCVSRLDHFRNFTNLKILIISEVWQGYDSKAYGVSNNNLKLQCKMQNRTRDIRNFPTQGWADTAFCTRKRSKTYMSSSIVANDPNKETDNHRLYDKHLQLQNMITLVFRPINCCV